MGAQRGHMVNFDAGLQVVPGPVLPVSSLGNDVLQADMHVHFPGWGGGDSTHEILWEELELLFFLNISLLYSLKCSECIHSYPLDS